MKNIKKLLKPTILKILIATTLFVFVIFIPTGGGFAMPDNLFELIGYAFPIEINNGFDFIMLVLGATFFFFLAFATYLSSCIFLIKEKNLKKSIEFPVFKETLKYFFIIFTILFLLSLPVMIDSPDVLVFNGVISLFGALILETTVYFANKIKD